MKWQRTLLLATDRSRVWHCAWGVKLLYFQKPSFDLPLKHFRKINTIQLTQSFIQPSHCLKQKSTSKTHPKIPSAKCQKNHFGPSKTEKFRPLWQSHRLLNPSHWEFPGGCPNVTLKKPCRKHSVFFGLDKDSNCESDGVVYLWPTELFLTIILAYCNL